MPVSASHSVVTGDRTCTYDYDIPRTTHSLKIFFSKN